MDTKKEICECGHKRSEHVCDGSCQHKSSVCYCFKFRKRVKYSAIRLKWILG